MMIDFKKAIDENCRLIVCPDCKNENEGFFTGLRVDQKTVPTGWYLYEIRHTETGAFLSLEPNVIVNHMGTFLTQKEILFKKRPDGRLIHYFRGKGSYTF
jgi:hypothetical protein